MKSVLCEVNLSFFVAGAHGTIQSTGNAVDIRFEKLADVRLARQAMGIVRNCQNILFRCCEISDLSLRVWVQEKLIAESGTPTGKGGFCVGWGRHWRIRPLDLMRVLLRR